MNIERPCSTSLRYWRGGASRVIVMAIQNVIYTFSHWPWVETMLFDWLTAGNSNTTWAPPGSRGFMLNWLGCIALGEAKCHEEKVPARRLVINSQAQSGVCCTNRGYHQSKALSRVPLSPVDPLVHAVRRGFRRWPPRRWCHRLKIETFLSVHRQRQKEGKVV